MTVTPNRGWTVPSEYADPYWAAFVAFANEIDADVQALFDSGHVIYQGAWNAATNTPSLTSSVGTKGHYYVVSVSGNTDLDGEDDWVAGDWAIFNGSKWQKVDNTQVGTTLDGAYNNFGSDPATVVVDGSEGQGDLKFDLVGQHSLDIDLGNTTGSIDGFRVYDGESTEYWRLLRKNDNAIDLEAALQNATHALSGNFDVTADGFVSLDASAPSNFTVDSANLTVSVIGEGSGDLILNSVNNVDIDGTDGVTIDSTSGGVSIDGVADSNFVVTYPSGALHTISMIEGGGASSIGISVTGNSTNGHVVGIGAQNAGTGPATVVIDADDNVYLGGVAGAAYDGDVHIGTVSTATARTITIGENNDNSRGSTHVINGVSMDMNIEGTLDIDSEDATLIQMSANDASQKLLRIVAENAGAGAGDIWIIADDIINLGKNQTKTLNALIKEDIDLNVQSNTTDQATSIKLWAAATGTKSAGTPTADMDLYVESTNDDATFDIWANAGGTGTINVAAEAYATTLNLGTGAAVQTVTLGSTNTTSSTTIQSGTGTLSLTGQEAVTINYNDVGGTGGSEIFQVQHDGAWVIRADENGALEMRSVAGNAMAITTSGANYTLQATSGEVNISTKTSGDVVIGAPPGNLTLQDQYLSSPLNLSQSGNAALSGFTTGTSIVGALNELRADLTSESLWNRSGTVISPQTADDSLDVTITSSASSIIANFDQQNTSTVVNGVEISSSVIQPALGTLAGSALKVSQTSAGTAPAIHVVYDGAGAPLVFDGSGPNLGTATIDKNNNLWTIAQATQSSTIEARFQVTATSTTGSASADNLRLLAQAKRDIATAGNVSADFLAFIDHASATGVATANFESENNGTGKADTYLRAKIANAANNSNATLFIQSTTTGGGTAWIDMDATHNIDIDAGTQIDITAVTAIQMYSGVASFWQATGGIDIYAQTSGDAKFRSLAGDVYLGMGDAAGAKKVSFRDSGAAEVAFVNSDGGALFTSIALDAGNLTTDTTTGTQIATATAQKLGLWGATPIVRPSAYTQTYSTADKTIDAYTPDDESGAYTGIDNAQGGTPYAQVTDLNALRVAYENLRAFAEDVGQGLNAVIDDLQAMGAVG